MTNDLFRIFDTVKDAIVYLEGTKIKKSNLQAKKWGFEVEKDLLNILTYEDIDTLVKKILKNKDYSIKTNIYFLSGNSKYCKIDYKADQNILIIEDRTEIQLLNKVKSDFISSLSHELRTPLSVAKGNTHILNDFLEDEKFKVYVSKISNSIEKIENIISQLTMLSMAQLGNYIIKPEILDPEKLLYEVLNDLNLKIKNKKVDITIQCDAEYLNGDKFIIYTILRNLISNAVKYSYEKSEIKVIIDEHQMIVEDSGIGIREEEKNRIFERFFRGNESPKYAKGSGLGLSVVKYFCEIANYKINYESKWMIGSKFIVKLKQS
ncbi:MAG: sensor histidine kinase [Thermotogota bacterium]